MCAVRGDFAGPHGSKFGFSVRFLTFFVYEAISSPFHAVCDEYIEKLLKIFMGFPSLIHVPV
jgi:hypothetical protein